jgi:hypothetical protein
MAFSEVLQDSSIREEYCFERDGEVSSDVEKVTRNRKIFRINFCETLFPSATHNSGCLHLLTYKLIQ